MGLINLASILVPQAWWVSWMQNFLFSSTTQLASRTKMAAWWMRPMEMAGGVNAYHAHREGKPRASSSPLGFSRAGMTEDHTVSQAQVYKALLLLLFWLFFKFNGCFLSLIFYVYVILEMMSYTRTIYMDIH